MCLGEKEKSSYQVNNQRAFSPYICMKLFGASSILWCIDQFDLFIQMMSEMVYYFWILSSVLARDQIQ
jgi:hypothetical protein